MGQPAGIHLTPGALQRRPGRFCAYDCTRRQHHSEDNRRRTVTNLEAEYTWGRDCPTATTRHRMQAPDQNAFLS